jgi:hypothetical protein
MMAVKYSKVTEKEKKDIPYTTMKVEHLKKDPDGKASGLVSENRFKPVRGFGNAKTIIKSGR